MPGVVRTVLLLCAVALGGNAIAISADPPSAEASDAKPEAATAAAAGAQEAFVPPPGFATKKRGKFTLYCKRDTTIGTRIKTEKCYDEQQMRDYMLALKENQEAVDRIRNGCGNVCVCGSPDLCNESIRQPRQLP